MNESLDDIRTTKLGGVLANLDVILAGAITGTALVQTSYAFATFKLALFLASTGWLACGVMITSACVLRRRGRWTGSMALPLMLIVMLLGPSQSVLSHSMREDPFWAFITIFGSLQTGLCIAAFGILLQTRYQVMGKEG